jgi:hypothetical protein
MEGVATVKKQSIARKYKHRAITKARRYLGSAATAAPSAHPSSSPSLVFSSRKSFFADLLGDGRVLDVNSHMHMYKDAVR